MQDGMPVYVKIEEYKEVLDIIHSLETKLADSKETLKQITQLKNEEDAELETWKAGVEDIEKKIGEIDKALFEPESQ